MSVIDKIQIGNEVYEIGGSGSVNGYAPTIEGSTLAFEENPGKDGGSTNGLTSSQITLLESVLYTCAFTNASGKSKVDALIASLRSGNADNNTDAGNNNDNITEPEMPPIGDTTAHLYTDEIPQTENNGKFNWGIGYKLNETTGAVEEDSEYAVSPMFYVSYGTNMTFDHNLTNSLHYVIIYNGSTKAFKEKSSLAAPYNIIRNNKGKDYYYRICSKVDCIVNPTSFTRGGNS